MLSGRKTYRWPVFTLVNACAVLCRVFDTVGRAHISTVDGYNQYCGGYLVRWRETISTVEG